MEPTSTALSSSATARSPRQPSPPTRRRARNSPAPLASTTAPAPPVAPTSEASGPVPPTPSPSTTSPPQPPGPISSKSTTLPTAHEPSTYPSTTQLRCSSPSTATTGMTPCPMFCPCNYAAAQTLSSSPTPIRLDTLPASTASSSPPHPSPNSTRFRGSGAAPSGAAPDVPLRNLLHTIQRE